MNLLYILWTIVILFIVIIAIKSILKNKINSNLCAICLAFSLTWIYSLILYYLDMFDNILVIGLMMGMTILGIFYTVERNVKKELTLFRLPFLLSLFLAGYYLLTFDNLFNEILILVLIWIIFGILYIYRNNKSFRQITNKIIECCKKW